MRRYTVVLIPEEDEYVVMVPSLPGCVTQGSTRDEALEMAKDAITGYLESLAAEGEPIPEETTPPHIEVVNVEIVTDAARP